MSDHDRREESCPDCHATEADNDVRTMAFGQDKVTGRTFTTVTWHTTDCPAYTVQRIFTEDGVRRAKEQSEWGRKEFPAAFERMMRAVMMTELDEAAHPFVTALVELVEAQGEDLGRFVPPERWAEILNRHFPPANPGPVRPGGEPTA